MSERTSCAVGRTERIVRGIVAVIVAAFGASMIADHPVVAAVFGIVALLVGVMAVTGWCPVGCATDPRTAQRPGTPTSAGYPDARDAVKLE